MAAPILTNPTATTTSAETAHGTVTTDSAGGSLYTVVTGSATAPSAAQVKAGLDEFGATTVYSGTIFSVFFPGAWGFEATGLPQSTTLYFHYMHENGGGEQSAVVTSPSFTTEADALNSPTGATTGATTALGTVQTNYSGGHIYTTVAEDGTTPTRAQVKAGQDASGAPGAFTDHSDIILSAPNSGVFFATGLSPNTTYYFHFMQEGGSVVAVTSPAFTTNSSAVNPRNITLATGELQSFDLSTGGSQGISLDTGGSQSATLDT